MGPSPQTEMTPVAREASALREWQLWLYTNYDCNLRCRYCVAESSPTAPRRALGLENVRRLVDEAVVLGFGAIFFTGGEPFLLADIGDMLAYSSARVNTTVLTNAIVLSGKRLDDLCARANDRLIVQVSLDGGRPEPHDAYRGEGTWQKTVDGIERLQARGFRVRVSTTETPVNSAHLDELCEFHLGLGIAEADHTIRPLARRGFSQEGLQLDRTNLAPEVTVNRDGVFWHPLSTDADMQVSKQVFPLAAAVELIQQQLEVMAKTGDTQLQPFT